MNEQEITGQLNTIFRDVFSDDSIEIHRQMTASEVEAWDSLSNIRMIVAVEQNFGIEFSTAEITDLANVGELMDVIQKLVSS